MKTKRVTAERESAIQKAREFFPRGSTVYTVLRHVSRSGMQRIIGVVSIAQHGAKLVILHPNATVAEVLDRPWVSKADGIRVGGAGMDMGFELVYSLACKIHGDGYALKHSWL